MKSSIKPTIYRYTRIPVSYTHLLSILSELCLPPIKVGGQFVAMKSVDTEDEIAAAKSAIKTLGGHIVKVEDYTCLLYTSRVESRGLHAEFRLLARFFRRAQ